MLTMRKANTMIQKYNFDWSFGNTKLKKDGTVSFGLPALKSEAGFITCPNAGICAALCYARQGRYGTVHVKSPRERNLWKLRQMADPAEEGWGWIDVQAELQIDLLSIPKSIKQVRIHDSGDFYCLEYMRTWVEVARQMPNLVFYCYTKMILDYIRCHDLGYIPPNMHIVQSIGGKQDAHIDLLLPHSRIFPTIDALHKAGYVDCSHTDRPVFEGTRLVGLVYHGARNLTAAQSKQLTQIDIGVSHASL